MKNFKAINALNSASKEKKKSITLFTALISSKLKFYHKWKIKIMENTVVSNTLTEKMII